MHMFHDALVSFAERREIIMKKVLVTIGVILAIIIIAFLFIKLVEYGSSLSTRGPEGFFIPY